jgi:hypothetical protein
MNSLNIKKAPTKGAFLFDINKLLRMSVSMTKDPVRS